MGVSGSGRKTDLVRGNGQVGGEEKCKLGGDGRSGDTGRREGGVRGDGEGAVGKGQN